MSEPRLKLDFVDPQAVTKFQPRRGDEVEAWLRDERDGWPPQSIGWHALDEALDRYRECSDYGLSLDDEERGDP